MRDSARVILFAAVLGIICAAMLVGATLFTAPYRTANEKAEEVRNFLSALDVPVDPSADAKTLLEVFNRDVTVRELGGLTFYEYRPKASGGASAGTPIAVAVPLTGMGLWGPINGVLSMEPDITTIRGIRFYQQEETPGLGGEIGADWFQKQFKGKRIVSNSGEAGFRILKPGGDADANSVDGISGATMTSVRVETMLSELAKRIQKVRREYVQ
ncbi:MAG TPA: FMN-binding protein [Spirochaetia bacterium]|nr:FMN-binding protein [Spirochaetia bacterium]